MTLARSQNEDGSYNDYGELNAVQLCCVDSTLRCTLQYSDNYGHIWGGEVNFAALAWSDGTVVTVGAMTYVELTLANGEVICFGRGVLNDADSFTLPPGFTTDKMFAFSSVFQNNSATLVNPGNALHGWSTWVDGTTVHISYDWLGALDSSVQLYPVGSAQVLVFAWKNNSGAVTVTPVAGGSWMTVQDKTTSVLGVGLVRLSHGQVLPVPPVAKTSTSLQVIPSPRSVSPLGVGGPSGGGITGVSACYLDPANVLNMVWGNWYGDAMVFAMFWGTPVSSGGGTVTPAITLAPEATTLIASAGYQQFSAAVIGESDPSVAWSVDGVAGGNSVVGTIDATGHHVAGSALGAHVVSAVSVANPSLSAAAAVTVEAPPVRPPYCFSGNVKTELPTGFAPLATLPPDRPFEIVNETGTHDAVLLSHDFDGEMIEFEPEELVTFEHPMKDGTRWPPASEFYAGKPMVHFTGKVYTLRVLSSNPDDQHFRLKNGDVAHNKMAWNPIDPSAG